MTDSRVPTFREMCESGAGHGGYQPQQLWLIPILLRSREQYYREAEEAIRNRIDEVWELSGRAYGSRAAFEQSATVANIWAWNAPIWWGLNDVIGWIDVQLDILEWEFQVALFLPLKRISRRLKDKSFAFEIMERVPLPSGQTNERAQESLIAAVERLATHDKVARYEVDLERWKRVVRNTNLIGVFEAFVDSLR
jgi:hypothetical protein